jgi:hypothetical protein
MLFATESTVVHVAALVCDVAERRIDEAAMLVQVNMRIER